MKNFEEMIEALVSLGLLIAGIFLVYFGFSGEEWFHQASKPSGFVMAFFGALATIVNM